jgi:hypothetical protein
MDIMNTLAALNKTLKKKRGATIVFYEFQRGLLAGCLNDE